MNQKRILVHTAFLFLLPLVVAWLGLSVWSVMGLVFLMLVWRWAISLSTFTMPEKAPELVLETISASHFVEKVRWNMDRAEIDYVEIASGGTLGAFFAGRTVPRLKFKTGAVRSQIGNSAEILRYLWGAYCAALGESIRYLEPTPKRLELERRLDRYGVNLQVWVYYHVLQDRALTLHLWGVGSPGVAAWQRLALRALFPLLALLVRRSFRVTPRNYEKACHRIEEMLAELETVLADGRASVLGGEEPNYTDFTFAALTGLWLQPESYGGGKADFVRVARERMPARMQADIVRWSEDNPRVVAWVERLYVEQRSSRSEPGERGAVENAKQVRGG